MPTVALRNLPAFGTLPQHYSQSVAASTFSVGSASTTLRFLPSARLASSTRTLLFLMRSPRGDIPGGTPVRPSLVLMSMVRSVPAGSDRRFFAAGDNLALLHTLRAEREHEDDVLARHGCESVSV